MLSAITEVYVVCSMFGKLLSFLKVPTLRMAHEETQLCCNYKELQVLEAGRLMQISDCLLIGDLFKVL